MKKIPGSIAIAVAMLFVATISVEAREEPLDYDMINKIMDEGLNRSEVMETTAYLSDVIGSRLPNSPGMREAARWTRDKLSEYGLENSQLERFEFGRGWTFEYATVMMMAPRQKQLQAVPISWHPGTNGPLTAEVVHAVIESKDDFEQFRGKLAGKIVLLSEQGEPDESSEPVFVRYSEEDIKEQHEYEMPERWGGPGDELQSPQTFLEELVRFLESEGAVAMVHASRKQFGMLAAEGDLHGVHNTPKIPGIVMAREDYDRLIRLLGRDKAVELSIDVSAQYYDDDHRAQNVWAEIPGRGARPEIVVAGAHLDSWFMGDGAVDNATGVAVVMEAARILSAVGAKPKRTIRFALWDAEELGMRGSVHHVEKHFASKPDVEDEELKHHPKIGFLDYLWPVQPGKDFERFSAYYNLDTGAGRIRGIWSETNPAVMPIFEKWFEPFHDMGADTVILNNTYGTDHQAFLAMGLPGFTFIQDPLDYESRMHHTELDTFSHVHENDLKQASIIMASFLWHTAVREERMPRMPVPTESN